MKTDRLMVRHINRLHSVSIQNSKLDTPFKVTETLSSLELSIVLVINVELEIVSRQIVFKSKNSEFFVSRSSSVNLRRTNP